MNLTETHLAAIDHHLRKDNWLLNEELIAELTDHYTHAIQDRMANGQSFDEAIKAVHVGFGGRSGLLKMEEQFQVEKSKVLDLYTWRVVRRLMGGELTWVTLAIFTVLLLSERSAESVSLIDSFFFIPKLFIGLNMLTVFIVGFIRLFKGAAQADASVLRQTSWIFVQSYLLAMSLILLDENFFSDLGFAIAPVWKVSLKAFLHTLCVIFLIAEGIGLTKFFRLLKNAS